MFKSEFKKVSSIYRSSYNRDFLDSDYELLVEDAESDFEENMIESFGMHYHKRQSIKKVVNLLYSNSLNQSNWFDVDQVRSLIQGVKAREISLARAYSILYFIECDITRRTFKAVNAFLRIQGKIKQH